MLAVAVGLGVLGVVLLLLGWRGRRRGEGRFCRRCGYDVTSAVAVASATHPPETAPGSSEPFEGSESSSSACSECGSDVSQPGAVRIGARASSPRVMAAGACVAICGAVLVIALWIPTIIPAPNTPTWLLGRDLDNPNRRGPAIVELETRVADGEVSRAQMDAIAERILDIHADMDQPWDPELGDLLFDIHLSGGVSGGLTREQLTRFVTQAFKILEVTLAPRPVLEQSADALPVDLTLETEVRSLGSSRRILAASNAGTLPSANLLMANFAAPTGIWINGKAFPGIDTVERQILLIGKRTRTEGVFFRLALDELVGVVNEDAGAGRPRPSGPALPPGEHTIEVAFRITIDPGGDWLLQDGSETAQAPSDEEAAQPLLVIDRKVLASFRVDQSNAIELVRGVRDAEMAAVLARRFRPSASPTLRSLRSPAGPIEVFECKFWLSFVAPEGARLPDNAPALAHNVKIQIGSVEYMMEGLQTIDAAWYRDHTNVVNSIIALLPGDLPRVSHARIRLHPDPSRTTSFTTSTTYLDEIIDLGWHPIQWQLYGDEAPNIIDLSAWIAAGAVGPMPEAPETTESD